MPCTGSLTKQTWRAGRSKKTRKARDVQFDIPKTAKHEPGPQTLRSLSYLAPTIRFGPQGESTGKLQGMNKLCVVVKLKDCIEAGWKKKSDLKAG